MRRYTSNPHQFLKDVKEFVKKHDIDLDLNLDNIPVHLTIIRFRKQMIWMQRK